MNALIILAHGSRRSEANQEIIQLAKKVSSIADRKHDIISHAYLEMARPDLLEAIDALMTRPVDKMTVMPYFLNSGNHVQRDIPALIEKAQRRYPRCQFDVSPCIGLHRDIPALILDQANLA